MMAEYTVEGGRRYRRGFAPSELPVSIPATCANCGGPAEITPAGCICPRCTFQEGPALWVIVEPGGSWFGPYGSRELAAERRVELRRRGDSLGVTLADGARILPARYTPDGIEWNWNRPA